MSEWAPLPGQTPIDPSGLRQKGITTRAELNEAEAENISIVVVKYLAKRPSRRSAPFELAWAKRLHQEMLGRVWKWAGQFRTHNLNVGADWPQVEGLLKNLLDDLASWGQFGTSIHDQAVMLHYRAVAIHPFNDGNGRWSRLLANIWLKQNGEPVTLWPEQAIGAESAVRSEYLAAVKQADQGELGPLADLHQRFAEGTEPRDETGPSEPLLPPK